jgi:hypothetical protein
MSTAVLVNAEAADALTNGVNVVPLGYVIIFL